MEELPALLIMYKKSENDPLTYFGTIYYQGFPFVSLLSCRHTNSPESPQPYHRNRLHRNCAHHPKRNGSSSFSLHSPSRGSSRRTVGVLWRSNNASTRKPSRRIVEWFVFLLSFLFSLHEPLKRQMKLPTKRPMYSHRPLPT